MRVKSPALAALAGLILAFPGQASADGAAPAVVKSRVDHVLAYSDQARVHRVSTVKLKGGERTVELATLPAVTRPGSLRVESKTATVVRTQLVTDRRRVLPRQGEAKRLLAAIEKLHDERRDLASEQQVLRSERQFLDSLALRDADGGGADDGDGDARRRRARPGIFVASWARVLDWLSARRAKIDARLLALAAEQRALASELHKKAVAAEPLDLGSVGRAATRVLATLSGSPGRHRISVSYLVPAVRWVPSYDLRYDPRTRKVEAVYYASVSQSTGEAWDGARLRFSTDMPRLMLAIPELATWTLGRKRDFEPTPRKRGEPPPPVWRPGPRPVVRDPMVDWIRGALGKAGARGGKGRDKDTGLEGLLDGAVLGGSTERDRRRAPSRRVSSPAPKPAPRPTVVAPAADDGEADMAYEPPAEAKVMAQSVSRSRSRRYGFGKRTQGGAGISPSIPSTPSEQVPWSDAGYRPPYLDPNLPAAAAKGYRFTLYAPGKHSVPSTGKARRVPLLTRSFAVQPVYRINPGNSPWAYLMASVKNGTGRPILRGRAHLFSGAMFRGKSWLNTSLPGHTIYLPLGVDDAVKVSRYQKQRTLVKGVVFKDDVTEYTVTVEIANNHAYGIKVEVHDQVPLKRGEKIEVEGFSARPSMSEPDDEGRIRWKGAVDARSVKKLNFTFKIKRPRDWELRQHNG